MTPQELVGRALALLLAHDMAAFAGLWAEDGVLEFPFAAPGYPARVEGRAAIAEYMRGYPDILNVTEIPRRVIHQSVDPE
ncbi:MAG TPA: nuclear transport factor 2 family protein, partial [Mycobacterium sp.]